MAIETNDLCAYETTGLVSARLQTFNGRCRQKVDSVN